MFWLLRKQLFFLTFCLLLTTCGIEEYYYLPQVSEGNITRTGNNRARVNIPDISTINYATGYSIFYRIYISGSEIYGDIATPAGDRQSVNPALESDFNALGQIASPSSNATTSATSFSNRNYYALEIEGSRLATTGSTVTIEFPTTTGETAPNIDIDGTICNILRSNGRGAFTPEPPDRLFFNSTELGDNEKATPNINADVARNNSGTGHTYVSMYIVAVGQHTTNFSPIYSKPTHISIFKLPNKS